MDEARKEQRTEALAREALDLSRDILLVRLRFLDGALSRFRLVSAAEVPFSFSSGQSRVRSTHMGSKPSQNTRMTPSSLGSASAVIPRSMAAAMTRPR